MPAPKIHTYGVVCGCFLKNKKTQNLQTWSSLRCRCGYFHKHKPDEILQKIIINYFLIICRSLKICKNNLENNFITNWSFEIYKTNLKRIILLQYPLKIGNTTFKNIQTCTIKWSDVDNIILVGSNPTPNQNDQMRVRPSPVPQNLVQNNFAILILILKYQSVKISQLV